MKGEINLPHIEGIDTSEEELHSCHVSTVHVQSEQAAETLQKPIGSYITIETGKPLSRHDHIMSVGECLAEVLDRVLRPHYHGKLCVCGIGNRDRSADALGPEVTRNLPLKVLSEIGLEGNFQEIVSLEPGTVGTNNINTEVLVNGVAKAVEVDCLLLIDSLTAKEPARMAALLNAICESYPEYTAIHNEEVSKFDNREFIKETPGAGTDFIKF